MLLIPSYAEKKVQVLYWCFYPFCLILTHSGVLGLLVSWIWNVVKTQSSSDV